MHFTVRVFVALVCASALLLARSMHTVYAETATLPDTGRTACISADRLRTGDVVYFAENTMMQVSIRTAERGGIGHVGIVVASGDGRRLVAEAEVNPEVPDVISGDHAAPGVRIYDLYGRLRSCLHPLVVRQLCFAPACGPDTQRRVRKAIRAVVAQLHNHTYTLAFAYWAYLMVAPQGFLRASYSANAAVDAMAPGTGMWCSWLVGEAYRHAGLLAPVACVSAQAAQAASIPYPQGVGVARAPTVGSSAPLSTAPCTMTPSGTYFTLAAALQPGIATLSAPQYVVECAAMRTPLDNAFPQIGGRYAHPRERRGPLIVLAVAAAAACLLPETMASSS